MKKCFETALAGWGAERPTCRQVLDTASVMMQVYLPNRDVFDDDDDDYTKVMVEFEEDFDEFLLALGSIAGDLSAVDQLHETCGFNDNGYVVYADETHSLSAHDRVGSDGVGTPATVLSYQRLSDMVTLSAERCPT
jgi:hypothetical protein